jgi:hypothetical protein
VEILVLNQEEATQLPLSNIELNNSCPLHKPQSIYATIYIPIHLILHILIQLVQGVGFEPTRLYSLSVQLSFSPCGQSLKRLGQTVCLFQHPCILCGGLEPRHKA